MGFSRFHVKLGLQEIELRPGETLVGRAPECTICLGDERLSRLHAKFIVSGNRIKLVDLGSRNGTYVNDNRVDREQRLQNGDVIRMGQTEMILHVLGAEPHLPGSASRTLSGSSATMLDMPIPGTEDTDVLFRVLKLGRLDEAEKLLRARVASLVRTDPPLDSEHLISRSVVDAMLVMADKSMDARWLHRLFKLYVSCHWWMSEKVQMKAEQLIRAIGTVGGDGLSTYLSFWSARTSGLGEAETKQLGRLRDLAMRDTTH